jgi:hypothetical protein
MKKSLLLVLILIVFTLSSNAQNSFDSEMKFGYGVNSATGKEMGPALVYSGFSDTELTAGTGQIVPVTATIVTNLNDLMKQTQTTASANGKVSYGAFKASAKAGISNFKSLKLTSYSQYLLLQVSVINAPTTIKNRQLTEEAKKLALENPDGFLTSFGDEFVTSQVFGGELYVLFEFNSTSREEKEKATRAIRATASYFSAKATGSYTKERVTELLKQTTEKKVTIIKNGGLAPVPEFDIDVIVAYARNFNAEILANPILLSTKTKPFRDEFRTATEKVGFVKIQNQRNKLDELFELQNKIQQNVNNAQYVIENIDLFEMETIKSELNKYVANKSFVSVEKKDINQSKEMIEEYIIEGNKRIRILNSELEKCEQNFTECDYDTSQIKFPNFEFPQKIGFTRNKLVTEVEINTNGPIDNGNFKINKSIWTDLGYCDWYEIKYIAFRGGMKYRGNEMPIYSAEFMYLRFQDNDGNLVKVVRLTSGEEIKWIPGTTAKLEFVYRQVDNVGAYQKNQTVRNLKAVIF